MSQILTPERDNPQAAIHSKGKKYPWVICMRNRERRSPTKIS